MTTPYVKTPVGDKLFTVQWDLEIVSPAVSASGEAFEAVDCELVSIHSTSSVEGLLTKLSLGNKDTNDVSINLNDVERNILLPAPATPVRFYRSSIEEVEGNAQIALLFREI